MNSIQIRQFKLMLEQYINHGEFPTEVKRLVVKEILQNLENQADAEIYKELEKTKVEETGENNDEA